MCGQFNSNNKTCFRACWILVENFSLLNKESAIKATMQWPMQKVNGDATYPCNEMAFKVPGNDEEETMQCEKNHHKVTQPHMVFGSMFKRDVYGAEKHRATRYWQEEQIQADNANKAQPHTLQLHLTSPPKNIHCNKSGFNSCNPIQKKQTATFQTYKFR